MKPFLGQVAEAFYREYNRDIQNMAFVFPNRRAGIFFKKYLSDINSTAVNSVATKRLRLPTEWNGYGT